MLHVKRFFRRLLNVVRSGDADQQLAREMAAHIALMQEELERRGMSPEAARVAATRAFGGVARAAEVQRDARSFILLEDLKRDVVYAVRALRRTPVFAAVAIATLALGIAATTAIFSTLNAVALRPLPYPDSDRLVRIVETGPGPAGVPGERLVGVTLADLPALRARSKTLSHVGIYVGLDDDVDRPRGCGPARGHAGVSSSVRHDSRPAAAGA